MKHYYFPAADFIGWIRIARPGSILGPQQNYLIEMQKTMREQGVNSPIWREIREVVEEKELVHRINVIFRLF
jgi:cell division cycle 14